MMGRSFATGIVIALLLSALPSVVRAAPVPADAVDAPSAAPETPARTIPSPPEGEQPVPAPGASVPGDDTDLSAPHTSVPPVLYGDSALPEPVRATRRKIIEAAASGDPEALRAIFDANARAVDLGAEETEDPVEFLRVQSGDDGGREILAILIEVLEAGYVIADEGTAEEVYLWPYFARYPVDKLTPPQLVELFKLVYAGDYQDMLDYGFYTSFRVGIAPDGTWDFFLTN